MEPEREIEKLLRACAKKRRVQAGDPPKLHPAARRRLQAEIARVAPPPDEADASLTLWELFRQRWAWLLGFALMVFFGATLFLPALGGAKHKAQKETAMARYNLMEIGTAVRMFAEDNNRRLPVSLDELTNELQLDLVNTILIDPQNGQRFVYVGAGRRLEDMPGDAVLAYSPTDKKGRAVLFADGRVEVLNGTRFSELTNRRVAQLIAMNENNRRQPTVAPAMGSDRLDQAIGAAGRPATASAKPVQFKNIASPASATPVLAGFQVQQTGNAIRIVDADGSVYEGEVLPAGGAIQNETVPASLPAPATAAPPQDGRAKNVVSRDEFQMARTNFFRVTGTNLTLKQNVVFAGSMLVISNTTPELQSPMDDQSLKAVGGGGGGGSPSTTGDRLSWSVSRIAGTAAIGGTNRMEIKAVPTP